jgi:hypothetical protein
MMVGVSVWGTTGSHDNNHYIELRGHEWKFLALGFRLPCLPRDYIEGLIRLPASRFVSPK